jgi:hypothetical protein
MQPAFMIAVLFALLTTFVVVAVDDSDAGTRQYDLDSTATTSALVNDFESPSMNNSSPCSVCCNNGPNDEACSRAFKGTPGKCCEPAVFGAYFCCPVTSSYYGDSQCAANVPKTTVRVIPIMYLVVRVFPP